MRRAILRTPSPNLLLGEGRQEQAKCKIKTLFKLVVVTTPLITHCLSLVITIHYVTVTSYVQRIRECPTSPASPCPLLSRDDPMEACSGQTLPSRPRIRTPTPGAGSSGPPSWPPRTTTSLQSVDDERVLPDGADGQTPGGPVRKPRSSRV